MTRPMWRGPHCREIHFQKLRFSRANYYLAWKWLNAVCYRWGRFLSWSAWSECSWFCVIFARFTFGKFCFAWKLLSRNFSVCIDDVVLDKSPPPTVRGNDENVAPTVDSIYEITSRVPGFREALPGNCTALTFAAESDKESEGVKRARAWKFNDQDFYKQYFQNARDK